ncbi:hypothetical protein L596_020897 [Steinernema carpocapsae]|uniref:Carbohydrate sulfotransferase n=1 Tax=Steinernema carpocapsae TaxID=34508 RepID=A0A4U5MVI5_STECR|nr:hypothetical protein L596_020897 [Steinernema carpocapsae]
MASVKKQVTYAFQSQKYASSRQFYCVLMFLVIMYVMVVYNFALTYFNGDTLVSAKETSVEETEFIQVIRNFFDRDYVSQRMLLEERQILNEKLKNYSLFELEEPISDADPSNIARTYAIVPPNIKLEEKLRVVYKKRLAACVIEKNMSTVLASIMCFLEDNKAFAEANRTITGEHFWTRFCKDKNEHNSIEDLLRTTHTKLEDWIMFALVRDPLERLLSAFVDKCILNRESEMDKSCYGCKQNIRCFVRNVYWRAKSFAENHEKNYNMEDVHTFPQNWHCSFKDRTNKMKIIKYYSEFKERKRTYAKIVDVLKEADIRPALISEVLDQIMAGSTYHTTINSPEKELARKKVTNSEDLMDMIYSLYYHDYLMFDFPFEYKDVHV